MNSQFTVTRFCIAVCLAVASICADGDEVHVPKIPFTLNLTLNTYSTSSALVEDASSFSTNSHASSLVKDLSLTQKMGDSGAALVAMLAFLTEHSRAAKETISTKMHSLSMLQKTKIVLGGVGGCLVFLLLALKRYEKALYHERCWSLWKSEKSLASLYLLDDDVLVRELLESIQARYTVFPSLDDFNSPLGCFFNDIGSEERALSRYEKVSSCIVWPSLLRRLFVDTHLLETLEKRKERLNYIRSKLWLWVARHKVTLSLNG